MARKSFLSKLIVIVFAFAIPLAAFAKDIGKPRGGGSSIEWDLDVTNYETATLTVLDLDGVAYVKEFPRGKTPSFRLNDLGGLAADGQYTYQITISPSLSNGVKRQLENARAANDEAAIRKIMKDNGLRDAQTLSGVITIENNQIVSPDAGPEEGANDSASVSTSPKIGNDSYTLPTGKVTAFDQVIPDDLIVQSSICAGFDCVDGESFGADTLRLKENNLRIHFEDTSTSAGYPNNDWRIVANDQASGGANKFVIEDSTAARNPMTIEAGAPDANIYVDSSGNIGFQQSAPGLDLHLTTNDTPALRLDQNNTGGFTAQTWDIGGNEANFFIRDLTGGSLLSFRIRPGAPTSSIDIAGDGDVGIGTASPDAKVDIEIPTGDRLHLDGAGDLFLDMDRGFSNSTNRIRYQTAGVDEFEVGLKNGVPGYHVTNGNVTELLTVLTSGNVGIGTTTPSSKLHVNGGDIRVSSGSFIDDGTTLNVPDYVFEDSYKLMPIDELKTFIRENKHLPNVPNVSDVKANGVNLSQFQMRLLEKVEELTLYTLAQHEENQELKKRLAALEEKLAAQQ